LLIDYMDAQFLILHEWRYVDFWLASGLFFRHPGQLFLSRMYPQHRRQSILHGAIKSVGIVIRIDWFLVAIKGQFL